MPTLGSQPYSSRAIGEFPMVPERYQPAMRFGVRFFELRFPRASDNSHVIFGPFDIVVNEEQIEGTTRARFVARLLTGREAQVRYEVINVRSGLAVAFMADDKYWHNRIVLVDNPLFEIMAMHTRDGIVSGTEIRMEIECLREVITEEAPIYMLIRPNGREETYFWTEPEALKELTESRKEKGWSVVRGKKRRKTKQVENMIRNYGSEIYGWTSCPEFEREIKPRVQQLIEERRRSLTLEGQNDIESIVKRVINDMTPEEIGRLIAQKSAGGTGAGAQPTLEDVTDEAAPAETPQKFTRFGLSRKKLEDLQSIARAFELDAERKKKDELIEAILQAQDGKPAGATENEKEEMVVQ